MTETPIETSITEIMVGKMTLGVFRISLQRIVTKQQNTQKIVQKLKF